MGHFSSLRRNAYVVDNFLRDAFLWSSFFGDAARQTNVSLVEYVSISKKLPDKKIILPTISLAHLSPRYNLINYNL